MKGDFTRFTFRPDRHYTSVHLQQGRVLLDADWNEQVDIDLYQRQAFMTSYIGMSGTARSGNGFQIGLGQSLDLTVSPGRFYVGGLLCELSANAQGGGTTYLTQPQLPSAPTLSSPGTYLVYLDVWQRNVTVLEDSLLREIALNGPDTTTRTQTVWQVKLVQIPTAQPVGTAVNVASFLPAPTLQLAAHAAGGDGFATDTALGPGVGYQLTDNCLYRVEIHQGGQVGKDPVTYKWSRENGSCVAAWTAQSGSVLTINYPGRDNNLGFAIGNWVELTDDSHELLGQPGQLVQVIGVQGNMLTVAPPAGVTINIANYPQNPKVRRWDMTTGTIAPAVGDERLAAAGSGDRGVLQRRGRDLPDRRLLGDSGPRIDEERRVAAADQPGHPDQPARLAAADGSPALLCTAGAVFV
jgi:hypothetical protein